MGPASSSSRWCCGSVPLTVYSGGTPRAGLACSFLFVAASSLALASFSRLSSRNELFSRVLFGVIPKSRKVLLLVLAP